jgi:hypothetical protein
MRRAVSGFVAALLLTGCGGGPAAPSPSPSTSPSPSAAGPTAPAVPGIEAEAVRLRTDEALGGQVQVRVTDTGTAPFTVTAVALDSPGFAALPATAVDTTFAPGRTIDLPTPFGAVDCAAEPDPAAARLTVVRDRGAPEDLRVPLAGRTLAQVHAEECAVAAVTAVVDVAVPELAAAPDGQALTGTVLLTRRSGDDPVEVLALERSVLLEPVVDRNLPVALRPEDDELALPVTFTPVTCDAHVLAETKKPFVFPLTVSVAGRAPVAVDLPVDDAQRALLQQMVDRVCG